MNWTRLGQGGFASSSAAAEARSKQAVKDDVAQYPEVLIEAGSVVTSGLIEAGVSTELAEALGLTVLERLADNFGGQVVYIPKASLALCQRRWVAMSEAHNGGESIKEIALKFGVGIHAVYRALAAVRGFNKLRADKNLAPLTSELFKEQLSKALSE